jgi:hypothetical protein
VIAICFSVVSFILSDRAQHAATEAQAQASGRALLQQLRNQYSRIAALESGPRTSATASELDADLGIASGLLRELASDAAGYDYLFIGQAYVFDFHPELATPLLKNALAKMTVPFYRLETFRSLAISGSPRLLGVREPLRFRGSAC